MIELKSMGSHKNKLDHFTPQNTVDMIAILFSLTYSVLRFIYPYGARLNFDILDQAQNILLDYQFKIYNAMPFLHLIILVLLISQVLYFFRIIPWLSQYVQLMGKGFNDSMGFLVLFIIFQIFFATSFHVLGAMMDDGDNYNTAGGYDTLHNDYAFIGYYAVNYISSLRSSVGDLVPPTYDYWTARYEGHNDMSTFYITIIWIVFGIQILLFVVFFLNYLIAIVSDSYANISENAHVAIIVSRDNLNGEHLRGQMPSATANDIGVICMSTVIGDSG